MQVTVKSAAMLKARPVVDTTCFGSNRKRNYWLCDPMWSSPKMKEERKRNDEDIQK